jgi:hypothetical protein
VDSQIGWIVRLWMIVRLGIIVRLLTGQDSQIGEDSQIADWGGLPEMWTKEESQTASRVRLGGYPNWDDSQMRVRLLNGMEVRVLTGKIFKLGRESD